MCSLFSEPAASGYLVSQKMERCLWVLLRMVGYLCLGKTEAWNSRGGKGQPHHGKEDVQGSPSRGRDNDGVQGDPRGTARSKAA